MRTLSEHSVQFLFDCEHKVRGLLLQLTDHRGVGGSPMDEEATAYGSLKEELAGVKPIASDLLSHENM
jgi:hypothetical protein